MSGVDHHVVTATEAGIRLDKVLASLPSVRSRARARQALESGKVYLDGESVDATAGGHSVPEGTRVEIRWNQPGTGLRRTAARAALSRADVAILHEDDAIIVVDKPAGLLTDAASREQARHRDTLRKRVRAWIGTGAVWPAHRIDRDTSGAVVFAKTAEARQSLHDQWVERRPLRAYLVVVEGEFPEPKGRFGDWMQWDRKGRVQRLVSAGTPEAWLAEADFSVVRQFGPVATQLEVRLVSGRRNQIRVHFMHAGHPLVGETQYRGHAPRSSVRFARQALHAHRLGFNHPTHGGWCTFEAPIPSDLKRLLKQLS